MEDDNKNILRHISVIYIIHSRFKSPWQDDNEIETIFNVYCSNFVANEENTIKSYLLGAFFSQLFQSVINLMVKMEKCFEMLVNSSY